MAIRRQKPPAPLRTNSDTATNDDGGTPVRPALHARNYSTITFGSPPSESRSTRYSPKRFSMMAERPSTFVDHPALKGECEITSSTLPDVLTPPVTPVKDPQSPLNDLAPIVLYDFSTLDYELVRAKVLGAGLWSSVYLVETYSRQTASHNASTPPSSPAVQMLKWRAGLVAVKVPSRASARDVFRQEARILAGLMRRENAIQHIVGFHGLDPRNGALVLEAVLGGSLEGLVSRLKHMTEVARHVELIGIFPGLARDLIGGLDFLHTAGVVHADIKPANVLLDISNAHGQQGPIIRARYIDFSASFKPACGDSTDHAGGTWDYMAPEQMRVMQKDLSTPTFASDVWSLGITLLTLIVGASPYAAACGGNSFRLRDAVKIGDPLSFVRGDLIPQQRVAACQDNVDCCRQALQKDRDRRPSAMVWKEWMVAQEMLNQVD